MEWRVFSENEDQYQKQILVDLFLAETEKVKKS